VNITILNDPFKEHLKEHNNIKGHLKENNNILSYSKELLLREMFSYQTHGVNACLQSLPNHKVSNISKGFINLP
jgi:hypothetical protein